jgi:hypothetical protein
LGPPRWPRPFIFFVSFPLRLISTFTHILFIAFYTGLSDPNSTCIIS